MITLGIIGVVAALTIPAILHKKRNLELESRFKTAYSTISQAVLRMSVDNPDIVNTYCPKNEKCNFAKDFSKYFQITYYIDNSINLHDLGYSNMRFLRAAGNNNFNHDAYDNGAFFTKNGMLLATSGCWWYSVINGETIIPVDFIVDTNGRKGPNRFGYDIFYFQIIKGNILLPSTNKYTFAHATSQTEGCCNFITDSNCSNPNDNGTACSYFALRNEYPQDTSKSYWKNLP